MPDFATNPADLVKIAIMAWVGVYIINRGLRMAGLSAQTTRGS